MLISAASRPQQKSLNINCCASRLILHNSVGCISVVGFEINHQPLALQLPETGGLLWQQMAPPLWPVPIKFNFEFAHKFHLTADDRYRRRRRRRRCTCTAFICRSAARRAWRQQPAAADVGGFSVWPSPSLRMDGDATHYKSPSPLFLEIWPPLVVVSMRPALLFPRDQLLVFFFQLFLSAPPIRCAA